jgi:HAE1 family hydrophobic/amphiphilic exporter-1
MVLITFNLAQGKYQNLLGKIINRRAITLFALVVQEHG